MFKDQELDRLSAEKKSLYEKLSSARNERKRLGVQCTKLHDELDAAYKQQSNLYERQQSAWISHKSFMQDCSNSIEFNKGESEKYYKEMISAFENASRAHTNRDGAGAKSWAESGHRAKAMMRSAKEQISYWVGQSRDAKFRFENSGHKIDFENAKRQTARLKSEFEELAPKLKNAKSECDRIQVDFDRVKEAYNDRLTFLNNERSERELRLARVAANRGKYEKIALEKWFAQVGRDYQYGEKGSDVQVEVKSGWSRDRYSPTTDVIIKDPKVPGKHYHLVIAENGDVLIDQWRSDH